MGDGEAVSSLKDPNNEMSTPAHKVKAFRMAIVGDLYTWTYFPYSDKGEAQGNVAATFDVHKNIAP